MTVEEEGQVDVCTHLKQVKWAALKDKYSHKDAKVRKETDSSPSTLTSNMGELEPLKKNEVNDGYLGEFFFIFLLSSSFFSTTYLG